MGKKQVWSKRKLRTPTGIRIFFRGSIKHDSKRRKVRSQFCRSEPECKKCRSLARSQQLARNAARWNAKLDGLKYLNLMMEGPSEEEVAAFRLDVEQRDYVQLLGDEEVRHFLDEENTQELAKKVYQRWGKVRDGNQEQASKQIYEMVVKPLYEKSVLHGWNSKNHRLCNMFARELADGTVRTTQIRSAMFVLSSDFQKQDIAAGVLAAASRQNQEALRIRGAKPDAELIQRASWHLVNEMGASVASLRELSMTMGRKLNISKTITPKFLKLEDGSQIQIPRSYHSICFPGAAQQRPSSKQALQALLEKRKQ